MKHRSAGHPASRQRCLQTRPRQRSLGAASGQFDSSSSLSIRCGIRDTLPVHRARLDPPRHVSIYPSLVLSLYLFLGLAVVARETGPLAAESVPHPQEPDPEAGAGSAGARSGGVRSASRRRFRTLAQFRTLTSVPQVPDPQADADSPHARDAADPSATFPSYCQAKTGDRRSPPTNAHSSAPANPSTIPATHMRDCDRAA